MGVGVWGIESWLPYRCPGPERLRKLGPRDLVLLRIPVRSGPEPPPQHAQQLGPKSVTAAAALPALAMVAIGGCAGLLSSLAAEDADAVLEVGRS